MKTLLISLTLIFCSAIAGITAGGHITQDTIWSPDNNPYVVTAFLYVDTEVTLTIQAGVEILIGSADCDTNWQGTYWNNGNEPTMKMIIVYGKIIALGSPDEMITFDRNSSYPTWRWGGICFMPDAPKSSFEYCHINNTLFTYQAPGTISRGALHVRNGGIHVRHCWFLDNQNSINGEYLNETLLIYNCHFKQEQMLQYGYNPYSFSGGVTEPDKTVSLYACTFDGRDDGGGGFAGFRYYESVFNSFINASPYLRNYEQRREQHTFNC